MKKKLQSKCNSTYVSISGTFTFSVNQSGLSYDNEAERTAALDDFKDLLDEWVTQQNDRSFIHLDYDEADIEVSPGE
jgi:hypothetical protein